MKNYSLVKEHPDHFVLHNGVAHFKISKSGLSEPTADKIRALSKGGEVSKVDPNEALNQYVPEKGIVGGTVRDGSDEERFHFGKFTFDIDKARDISKQKANAKIPVSSKWLDKIKIDKEAAMRGTSDNPVFIAQIHTPHGLKSLLIDGNHRMHRAVELGEKTIPAYVFTPEQSISLLTDKYPKDELKKSMPNGSVKKMASGGPVSNKQTPYEAGIEKQAQEEANQNIQSPEEKQIESQGMPQESVDYVKYNNPDKFAGGTIPYRKPQKYNGSDKDPSDQIVMPTEAEMDAEDAKTTNPNYDTQQQFSQSLKDATSSLGERKAMGGEITNPAKVKSIAKESQSEAIRRYADGNPTTLSRGGAVHHNVNQGKNTLHFHFYDSPQHSDKQPEASPTPLDNYVHLADPQGTVGDEAAMQLSAQDIDPNVEPGNVPAQSDAQQQLAQDQAAEQVQTNPDPQQSANNLANTMGQPQPFPDTSPAGPNSPAPGVTVAPGNQIPVVSKSLPPTPVQNVDMLTQFDANQKAMADAVANGDTIQAKGLLAQNDLIKQNLTEEKQRWQTYQDDQLKNTAVADALFRNVVASKVDPNRYWADKSTAGKIMAGIGVILGGAASGMNGGSGQNQAFQTLQTNIQRDIDAQKNDQTQAMNLYKMGLERYNNTEAAQQFATLHSNVITQGLMQMAANNTNNQLVKNNADFYKAQLGNQNIQYRQNLAITQAALNSTNGPQQPGGVNPDKLRLLTMSGIIPKELAGKAQDEYGDYQKLSNSLDEVDNVFKQAQQDSTYTQRMAEAIPGGNMLPTVRAGTKNYLAETNALLDKYTKDLTGRVTPQSMENLKHSIPLIGDPPEVQQRKLNTFKDIVREAYKFPVLMTNHVLSPNDPVIQSSATRNKRFTPGPPKTGR